MMKIKRVYIWFGPDAVEELFNGPVLLRACNGITQDLPTSKWYKSLCNRVGSQCTGGKARVFFLMSPAIAISAGPGKSSTRVGGGMDWKGDGVGGRHIGPGMGVSAYAIFLHPTWAFSTSMHQLVPVILLVQVHMTHSDWWRLSRTRGKCPLTLRSPPVVKKFSLRYSSRHAGAAAISVWGFRYKIELQVFILRSGTLNI